MLEKISICMLFVCIVIGCIYGALSGFIVAGVYGLILSRIEPPDQGQ